MLLKRQTASQETSKLNSTFMPFLKNSGWWCCTVSMTQPIFQAKQQL